MSKPIVITLNAEKGGTGKTTLAVHLAAGLAHRGKSVALLDTDPQANATLWTNTPFAPGFYNLMVRDDDYTFTDVAKLVSKSVYRIPGQEPLGYFYIVPSNKESFLVQFAIQDESPLQEQLVALQGVDVVIIDTPPTPGVLMSVIYRVTDFLIAPTQLELLSMSNLVSMMQAVNREGVELMTVVPNMFRSQTRLHTHNLAQLMKRGQSDGWHISPPIKQATIWPESAQTRRMVWSLVPENSVNKSPAVKSIFRLLDFVEARIEAWQNRT